MNHPLSDFNNEPGTQQAPEKGGARPGNGNPFDIQAAYDSINSRFPRLEPRPLIGITGNYETGTLKLLEGYYRCVEAAGGVPVVIPPGDERLLSLLDRLDGLILSGGADVNPLFAGEDPVPALHGVNPARDRGELLLTRLAYDRQIPLLGICRGIQVLAMALGGSVHQDLATALPGTALVKHDQDMPRHVASHYVEAEPGSLVERLLGRRFAVNSFHHQAVAEPGPRLRVTARSRDGVVEAVESTEQKSILGVQWHPECFLAGGDETMMPLFRHFVTEADSYRRARIVHRNVLTLDSHCDTPMLFDQGVRFDHRDPRALMDLCKMEEGGLDAVIMAAYLPQRGRSADELQAATARAHALLDGIGRMADNNRYVALARTPAELLDNKRHGRRSIMTAIENGYAVGRDPGNVARFRQRGVVYMTLCHNGDNDLCDSACRSTGEHGGLSELGRDVVREMNRTGMMVDLSHAAESTFYDAVDCSAVPVVCSHSSARALCNHPRNLTDDQLRRLAETGGVAQVTLYHGFLREDGEATVRDAVRHLMHMIDVAGIDHVGIGTDFDGDGGVPGCASASELINFTRLLLAEGLTEDDLRKVWGANFLRVMQQAQDFAATPPPARKM